MFCLHISIVDGKLRCLNDSYLGQSDLVYQYKISCLSILIFVEDCGNQVLSPVINQGDHSPPNIGVAGESVRLRINGRWRGRG